MTKDVVIGTVTGVCAVLAMAVLSPRAQSPASPPLRELLTTPSSFDEGLGKRYLPTTRPDPTRLKLEQTLGRVEARGLRLDKMMAFLADATGVNFFVNWRALEAAGISREAPVTLDVQGVTAATVLKLTLKEAGGGNVVLAYHVANGVVTVSTAEDLSKETYTRIYDVRDLIEEEVTRQRRLAGDANKPVNEQEAADMLVRLIEETVDPITWRDAGGSSGGIRYFGGRLIVTQTLENHEQILELLSALRLTADRRGK